MISKMSTKFVCGKMYSKVLTTLCNDLWSVGPWKDASGKREETKKGKYNNVVCRLYGRSLTWYQTDGAMGIVGGDCVKVHAMVREGCTGMVDVGGSAV